MPLSSLSGPSFGSAGSATETMACASLVKAASDAASSAPKSAGGRARNMRPNGPSKEMEPRDRVRPRTLIPCARGGGTAMLSSLVSPVVLNNKPDGIVGSEPTFSSAPTEGKKGHNLAAGAIMYWDVWILAESA